MALAGIEFNIWLDCVAVPKIDWNVLHCGCFKINK